MPWSTAESLIATQHVEVSYVRTRRMVLCKVKDPGTGFSLEELKHSAVANPPDQPFLHMAERENRGMRPGGFGILMSKKLVDDLIYNDKGNEVLLIKYLDHRSAALNDKRRNSPDCSVQPSVQLQTCHPPPSLNCTVTFNCTATGSSFR